MAAPLSLRIAEFVTGISLDRLPDTALRAVKLLVLDTLGCALGGVGAEPVRRLEAILPPPPDARPGAARCLGSGRPTTAEGAAGVNGAMVRYLDFMDVYWSRDICHPAENIPVAIACVEEAGGSGRALIEAIVAGYEVQIRLCDAFSFQDRGFHHVSAAGFVVPYVAGKAWGQPAGTMAHGSALGGMRHLTLGALSHGKLSMAKAIGYSANAAAAITAARLAGSGFTGPLEAYEWLFGRTAGPIENTAALALDFDFWRLEQVSLKQYPVQYALQAPVAAAIRLHGALRGRLAEVATIRARVRPETLARAADPAKFRPMDRETADHSLPSCVAMALCDGVLTERQFAEGRFRDPDVMQLTSLVEPVGDAEFERLFPDGRPGAVEVVLRSGERLQAVEEVPLGDRRRPMDDAAIQAKFLSLAEPVIGSAQAGQVMELVASLEDQPGIDALLNLCSSSAPS
ncbi:MmgE/PrpD family protein [Roseomonas populi]|uniref:MmgE/PrpD family protein n=1 Tax=Roseomonas populi TaxID=3121582 RepID=A0ABT1XDQ0_9PROT|nr:MmgE/PrpD family protein [Roseomonas pecuniae]MCR0985563.1 MmgE/PrpD family protein [Roseomonas pecuniae]